MGAPFRDCMSCVVTERANSSCECVIEYPAPGAAAGDIQPLTTVTCSLSPGESGLFLITSVSKPINGIIQAHGELQFYALAGNAVCRGFIGEKVPEGNEEHPYMAYPTRGMTLSKLIRYLNGELRIVEASVTSDMISEDEEEPGDGSYIWEFDAPTTARQIMAEAARLYGGIWSFNGMSANLSGNRGAGTHASVTFADNALSQTVVYDLSEQYTHVCPYWTGDEYIEDYTTPEADGQMEKITVYCDDVYIPTGFSGAFKPYMLDCSSLFKVKPESEDLEAAAGNFISQSSSELGGNTVGAEDVNFVDLSKTIEGGEGQTVSLGGSVTVNTRYGDSFSGTCVGLSYDSVRDRYVSLEVASNDSATRGRKSRSAGGGSNRSSRKLTGFSIAELRGKIADLEYAVKHPKQVFPKKVERVSANEVYAIYDGYRETWYADGTGDERHNIRKVVTLEEQT